MKKRIEWLMAFNFIPYRLVNQQNPSATLRTRYSKLRIKPFEINGTKKCFHHFHSQHSLWFTPIHLYIYNSLTKRRIMDHRCYTCLVKSFDKLLESHPFPEETKEAHMKDFLRFLGAENGKIMPADSIA